MEKKTPLYDCHLAAGGTIVPFAGYLLPVNYPTGIIAEHNAVRTAAGLFDVSHMGEIIITGFDALWNINNLFTNDFTDMQDGQVRYSVMCNEEGGCVDDLLVYRYNVQRYLVVVNASNRQKDFLWMTSQIRGDVRIEDVSDTVAQIALQGPAAREILLRIVPSPDALPSGYYTFLPDVAAGGSDDTSCSFVEIDDESNQSHLANDDSTDAADSSDIADDDSVDAADQPKSYYYDIEDILHPKKSFLRDSADSFNLSEYNLGDSRDPVDPSIHNVKDSGNAIHCLISCTGYTGESGYEIYLSNDDAPRLWNLLLQEGKDLGLIPCGLGSRDTLRLEAAMPLYGHEMDEHISPLESSLSFAVKFYKDDFIGRYPLIDRGFPKIRRVGLKITGRGIAREHQSVYHDGNLIGSTTSGTHAPYLHYPIAMALIDIDKAQTGLTVQVEVRPGRLIDAEIVPLPFYKKASS
ncbi:MAG: glycine cleavage system protein T [Tannerella sp.]|jgi:glycine cleavage system aminomethyltransferase T|nr:glycine cleavage system protein T [Tannerella sp.]